MNYAMITDIAFLNSNVKEQKDMMELFNSGLFNEPEKWESFELSNDIPGLMDSIQARMKYYMSKLSLGVYNVLEKGPYKNLKKDDEIFLFSGFTEIETVNKIGELIVSQDYSINPALFPNSVHHISLCYFAILKKITNYCTAITDGPITNFSFISFIKLRSQIPLDFVVVTGEENSNFFIYEEQKVLKIVPSFAAYKVIPNSSKGFYFGGVFNTLDELKNTDIYQNASHIFADKETFLTLKQSGCKNIYTEFPIIQDNICGIAYRLALPFYLDLSGKSLIIDKAWDQYHYFVVDI